MELICIAKQQAQDIEELKRINKGFADRIAGQSEILSKKAEVSQQASVKLAKAK